jgi:carbon-monoxide dehydrogenase medium subunit
MNTFEYHRPSSVSEAIHLLQTLEDAQILAGGHTLLPTMKQRLASPANLVDLGAVTGLSDITVTEVSAKIGAMTRHAQVAASGALRRRLPALSELAGMIGDPQVRNRGTIGGSIANNDPAADYPAACLALDATIITNKREIRADDYFMGMFETALDEHEIITSISFPVADLAAYVKFRNPASRYALVGVFVARRAGEVRVAVTGAGSSGVFRWEAAEEALTMSFDTKPLEALQISADNLNSDLHADAEYRAHLIAVLTRRGVAKAIDDCVENSGWDSSR